MKQTVLLLVVFLLSIVVVSAQELKEGTYTINGLSFQISYSDFDTGGILISPTKSILLPSGPDDIEGYGSSSIAASVKFDKRLLDLTTLNTLLSQGRVAQLKANNEDYIVSVITDISGKVLSSSLDVPKNSLLTKEELVKILTYLNSRSYQVTSFRGLHKQLGCIFKDEIFRF
ncbi:hypothetical protein [Sphingobacterium humi]|uniref:Uncharacterized protein n=1 Tax=Sphingobacterium humi TaxID=1796905 RepID=A0A6N8KWQ9_9SPHI|nr:hypothetical protein [Sphingobacterium humi]MVZ61893.1 hypothetical protein [Sphingobacterium humi]